jgi:hypothetical protein
MIYLSNAQAGPGSGPACYSMGTGELSLRMQGPRREGGHFHVVSRLRISGAILSPYPRACMPCTGTALVCL